jgi:peptide/nickel transport system permease protein
MSVSFALAVVVGVTAGIIAAQRRNSALDIGVTTVAFIGVAMPVFWFGLLLLIFLAVKFRVLPAGGMYTIGAPFSITDRIRHLILPVTAVAFQLSGGYARYVRTGMLEVLGSDYIRTANAKGLHPWVVIGRHALRNALTPLVTLVGTQLPWIVGGFVITESIFSWPGMGRLFWAAAVEQDYPVIMGVAMLVSISVVSFNLVVDVLYAVLDPRITYE